MKIGWHDAWRCDPKVVQGSHSWREHVDKQIDEVKEHVDKQFDELKMLMGQCFPDAKRRRHE